MALRCFNALVERAEFLQVGPLAHRSRRSPNEFGSVGVLFDRAQKFGKRGGELLLGVALTMQSVVEVNDVKPILPEHHFDLRQQCRIAHRCRRSQPAHNRFAFERSRPRLDSSPA